MKVLDSAIAMALRGSRVFPLVANNKRPAITQWKKEATSDCDLITKIFENTDYNLGIATGAASNFIVIDIDIKDGKNGLTALTKKFGDKFFLPENALMQKTPTGGLHIFVDWQDKEPLKNGVNILGLTGVDIRGDKGYVVGAGSTRLINGEEQAYRVKDINAPYAEVTGWIEELLNEHQRGNSLMPFDPTKVMEGIDIGERNDTLFRYACHLSSRGFDIGMVTGFVKQAASLCNPAFPEDEAELIIANAFAYQPKIKKPTKVVQSLEELL